MFRRRHLAFATQTPAWAQHVGMITCAGMGVTLLFALQIVVLHRLNGRYTPWPIALSWASATTVLWTALAIPGVAAAAALARRNAPQVARVAAYIVVAIALVVFAVTLRAGIDGLLPHAAQHEGSFVAIWMRYAVRWAGPGMLAAALIVVVGTFAAASRQASLRDPAAPAASAVATSPAPDAGPQRLMVRSGSQTTVMDPRRLTHLVAQGNYVLLHAFDAEPITARMTMSELEAALDGQRFMRAHRSVIIAVDAVRELRTPRGLGATALLRDGTVVPVSRTGRRVLEERLAATEVMRTDPQVADGPG